MAAADWLESVGRALSAPMGIESPALPVGWALLAGPLYQTGSKAIVDSAQSNSDISHFYFEII
jgi:hypothetical protein